jgi:hypothetical protein
MAFTLNQCWNSAIPMLHDSALEPLSTGQPAAEASLDTAMRTHPTFRHLSMALSFEWQRPEPSIVHCVKPMESASARWKKVALLRGSQHLSTRSESFRLNQRRATAVTVITLMETVGGFVIAYAS